MLVLLKICYQNSQNSAFILCLNAYICPPGRQCDKWGYQKTSQIAFNTGTRQSEKKWGLSAIKVKIKEQTHSIII